MKKFTQSVRKYFLAGLAMCIGFAAVAQRPNAAGTDLIDGNYIDTASINLGLFNQMRLQATVSAASGVRKLEFPEYVGQYFNVWRSYNAGYTLAGFNQVIAPAAGIGCANWNSNYGGSGILLPAITAGNYYTINIMSNRGYANDTMAVLETGYNPVTITAVSIPIDTNTVGPACSPTIVATLSGIPSGGEYVYLRYSVNGFLDSSSVILMSVSGNIATCQIPAYPAGTHIDYYVLTSPNGSLISTGPGSGYYDCQTLNLKNGSIGNNFRYTVKNLPVPSVYVTVSLNPVCSGTVDSFIAHGVNNGTVASDYQWYKNGNAVGTNDSIYTDANLHNNDSVWVLMTANLGCPVLDTSNHIIVTVNPTPSPTGRDTSVCPGSTVDLSALVTGASNTLIYRLGTVTGTTVSNPVTVNATATYTILDSTTATGCFATTTVTTTALPVTYDSVYVIASNLSFCNHVGADTFIAVVIGGGPSPQIIWTLSENTIATGDTLITGPYDSLAGNFFQVILNSSAACPSSASFFSAPFVISLYNNSSHTQYDTICPGSSIIVGTATHNAAGSYTDTLHNASVNGCDSIVTTNLTVYSPDTITQSQMVCNGSSYSINGHTYNTTGTYVDTLTGAGVHGCDSIITTNLTVNPNTLLGPSPDTILVSGCYTIPAGVSSVQVQCWGGGGGGGTENVSGGGGGGGGYASSTVSVTPGGTYMAVVGAGGAGGTVAGGTSGQNGGTSSFNGVIATGGIGGGAGGVNAGGAGGTGTGTITYTGGAGFWSNSSGRGGGGGSAGTGSNGNNASFGVGGTAVTGGGAGGNDGITGQPGSTPGGGGGESFYGGNNGGAGAPGWVIITYTLPLPQGSLTANGPFCNSGTGQLTWAATVGTGPYTVVYNDGTTNDTVTGVVSGTPFNTHIEPVAASTTYSLVSVTDANNYTSTSGFSGSSATITVYSPDTFSQLQAVCYGHSYTYNGHTYTTTGTYKDTLTGQGSNGCDSVVTTNLTVYAEDSSSQYLTVCYGYSFGYNGHTYSVSGTYLDTLTGQGLNGCDRYITTYLTVYGPDTFTQSQNVCLGQSYNINGHSYNTTGTYIDTLIEAAYNGCDSFVTTNLTVLQPPTYTQYDTFCFGGSITVNGHTYTTTGVYNDTLVNGASNGCDSIIITNLTVNPLPVINLGPDQVQCGGNTKVDAGNPGSTFIWSDNTTKEIDTISTSGNYTVTVTNIYGCTATGGITVYIKPAPVVDLGPTQNICGDSVVLDAGTSGQVYLWNTTYTGEFLTVTATGLYSVTVTDTASSCSATSSVQINVNPVPVVSLGNDTGLCGGPLLLSVAGTKSVYIWSNGDTTSQIIVTASGNYSVTVTNAEGCSASSSVLVTIYSKPNLGADVTDSICPHSRANLYNYYINSGLALTYSTPAPASVDTGTYTVVGTNSNGCTDTALITITYRQAPSAGGNKTDSICPGYTYNLTTLYPNTGYSSYVWNTQNPTAVDTGTYILVVTGANGCTDTAVATIINRVKPNLGGNKTDSICPGYTYNLTTLYPNTGYTTYTWVGVVNDSAVGAGTYQLIVSNASGCGDTAFATIKLKTQPVVTIPAYPNLCSTNPAFALTGATPAGGVYYVDNVLDSIFHTGTLGAGTYRINYVYTTAGGCIDSASTLVTIFPQPQIIDTVGLPTVCTGSPLINLNNFFSPAGGVFSGAAVTGIYFYPSLAPVGSDSITYIYTDQNGCMDTAGRRITVLPSVHVTLHTNQSNLTICQGQSITFTASGAVDYQFFVNDSAWTTLDTTSTFTTSALSNHDQIFVLGTNGCSSDSSDFIIIDVIPLPTVVAGPDTTIDLGQKVQLYSIAAGASSLVYAWSPDSSLNVTNIPNPVYSGADTIVLQVKVTDINGCTAIAYDTINVRIPDNILLPNVITPNGDGKNDTWVLNPKINLAGSHLVIFNRWGELVYETYNYNNDWGGTYKTTGQKVPDGTYYYVLTVPAQDNHTYKGPINVLDSEQN